MALRMPSAAPAPTPVRPGPGRASALPLDAGRATELLYVRHGGTVFRYAWHLLGRREDAEDATQATFLAVHSALAGGTAVLEPGAWVLGIARNECMGRLRRSSGRPASDALTDDAGPVALGSVESQAAVREEMRIARQTLGGLPEQEREAFILREWLGLETGEVALALGVEAGYVEYLTARARRSLVLAVGGLEAPVGCAATRTALEAGTLDRAGKVHLLRCPVCRGVRRALRPRKSSAAPAPAVAERLAGVLPGFGAGGGGIIAALTAKAAAAPILTKAAAIVAATLLAGGAVGQAIRTSHPAHHRSAGVTIGRGGEASALAPAASDSGHAALVFVAPAAPPRHSRTTGALASTGTAASRGGAAERGGHSGDGRGQGDGRAPSGDEGASSGSGDHSRRLISVSGDGKGDSGSGSGSGTGEGSRSSGSSHSSGSDDGSSATAGSSQGSGDGTGSSRSFVTTTGGTSGSATGGDGSSDGGSASGSASGSGGGSDDGAASVAGTGGQDSGGGGATTPDGSGGTTVTTGSD